MTVFDVTSQMAGSYAMQLLQVVREIREELLTGEVLDRVSEWEDRDIETLRAVTP